MARYQSCGASGIGTCCTVIFLLIGGVAGGVAMTLATLNHCPRVYNSTMY